MEVLSEHLCEGWLEGYLLTGRHGLFATYEAFAMVVGVDDRRSTPSGSRMRASCRGARRSRRSTILLTSTCWRNDHNGFSHQGPGLHRHDAVEEGHGRAHLPAARRQLPASVADHCLRSRNYVNLIVIDKQPQLQWLDIDAAREHCARGASVWEWASNDDGGEPDVVLACAGDIADARDVAAAWLLRQHAPELRVRVVNVVDLMTLFSPREHPHGMTDDAFVELFTRRHATSSSRSTATRARSTSSSTAGRIAARFHVRGFNEQGTTTTPFDMVVLNEMSRFHLAIEALRRSAPAAAERATRSIDDVPARCSTRHRAYVARALRGHARDPRLDVADVMSASSRSTPARRR